MKKKKEIICKVVLQDPAYSIDLTFLKIEEIER